MDKHGKHITGPGGKAKEVSADLIHRQNDRGKRLSEDYKEIIIDNRILRENDKIYDLVDVVEDPRQHNLPDEKVNDTIIKQVSEISEKIAKEMFPRIAERIIREEIEKLKNDVIDTEE
jgi:hypothetical protein